MRMTLGDILMSLGAVAVLVLTLLAADHRIRDQISMQVAVGQSSTEWLGAGARLVDMGRGVYVTARDQSVEHAPLVIFCAVALGLVILMVKS